MGPQADSSIRQGLVQSPAEVTQDGEDDCAGDPPCLAALICPSCGGVLSEGHQPGCEAGDGPA